MPKATLAKGDETILLVEENEIERKRALSTLQRHRYRVLEAASSVEALMLTRQYNGIVHLTVSPLVMPAIGGHELARRLLRQHPTMKTLLVSGYDDETIQHHRINQRFVLQQPYRQAGLIEKVERCWMLHEYPCRFWEVRPHEDHVDRPGEKKRTSFRLKRPIRAMPAMNPPI